MTVLRTITYVLVSLASALFITVVIYAGVKVNQLQTVLESFPGFGPTSSSYSPGYTSPTFEAPTPAQLQGDAEYCARTQSPMCDG
jgi:hypothetical protein